MRTRIQESAFALAAVLAVLGAAGIGRAQPSAKAGAPTFSKDIAPIFQKACQNCHRPDSIAPMSLLTYKDARPWAKAIRQKVMQREMPPWFVDKNVGIRKFKDDPSLSDQEIATITAWVDAGAPEGSSRDLPPARTLASSDAWHIGTPDLIVSMPVAFNVKPENSDWWGNFLADSGLTEDRYIKAVETKPSVGGGIKVVHHAVTSLVYDDGTPSGGTLNEYAVGKNGDIYPEGSGKLIKAGAQINFNMHYHAIGEPIKDQSQVAFVFYPKGYVPKHVMNTMLTPMNDDLDIPAGAENVRSDAYFRFEKPTKLTSYMPHMHNRGKAQCLEAIYPNMVTETISCVSHYNFGWQIVYNYADDVAPLLPAGTIMHTISWHDNSTKNPWNPDPRNWVGFGNRTSDDMARSWLNYYYMSDEEFKQEVSARKAPKSLLSASK
jgi:hypothetical protein